MQYIKIKKKVLEVYRKCNVKSFPTNCFDLLEQYGYECVEYTEQEPLKQEYCFKVSNDAFRLKDKIFYNDTAIFCRRRFSLMHELGHIVLKHYSPYTKEMEREANYFSGYILAPPMAIHYSHCKNTLDVSKLFKLTYEAANYAFIEYYRWRRYIEYSKMSALDHDMYYHFYDPDYEGFVWNICYCQNCGTEIINNPTKYCDYCLQAMCSNYQYQQLRIEQSLVSPFLLMDSIPDFL